MKQQNDKPLVIASLNSLKAYAGHLAAADLEMNRETISGIRFLSEVMASYHCIGGYEADAESIIRKKYLAPLDNLLAGQTAPAPDLNEAHMKAILNGIAYYRKELELDYEPVYERDLKICTDLAEEIKRQLSQENMPGWEQNMQL
nr:hypothetical protein [uncultured Eisenbergiella sp.]